jgi:hypothetical protein
VILAFGANMTATSFFALANGDATQVQVSSDQRARATSPKAGTSVTLAWNVGVSGGLVRLQRNGALVGSNITLSGTSGTNTQALATAAGDFWAIQYVSGTAPNQSNFQLMIS